MKRTKLIFYSITALIIGGMFGYICIQNERMEKIKFDLSVSVNNNKAYEAENGQLKEEALQYIFTIGQLENSQDSIAMKLNEARKKLKIKDKELKELEYIASHNQKTDTLVMKDTIFIKDVKIDTLISDKWSSLYLQLAYPNKIVADYSFKNEMSVIASTKKETVKPPKKCAIARWFQKKQRVIEVDVFQENPYCKVEKHKHFKIVK